MMSYPEIRPEKRVGRPVEFAFLFQALFLCGLASSQQDTNGAEVVYEACAIDEYYTGLLATTDSGIYLRDDLTRAELEMLLESTHRNVLEYTNNQDGADDVWKALIDLDAGDVQDTVRLIYRQVDVPALPHGGQDNWNREHLWPVSRGIGESGADYTDIHHIRPADTDVNAARGNLFFGDCGLVALEATCESPGHEEAAADTASDGKIFRPPAVVRGDIARAIFYMDMRYSSSNNNGVDLMVTDCPLLDGDMAYRSQLLQWHEEDPVSEEERQRNQRACERWQGNRNPFVDFPAAVQKFFGQPQLPLGDSLGYAYCTYETEEPTNLSPSAAIPSSESPTTGSPTTLEPTTALPTDIPITLSPTASPFSISTITLPPTDIPITLSPTASPFSGSTTTLPPTIASPTTWPLTTTSPSTISPTTLAPTTTDPAIDIPATFVPTTASPNSGSTTTWLPTTTTGSNTTKPTSLSSPTSADLTTATPSTVSPSTGNSSISRPSTELDTSNAVKDPCVSLFAGDILFIAMNVYRADMVAFVAFKDLEEGLVLHLTDNAWTGSELRTNEGTVSFQVPAGGISAGTVFGYGPDTELLYGGDWESAQGQFQLSELGDNILLYCKAESSDQAIRFLCALDYSGVGWADADFEDANEIETTFTALPQALEEHGRAAVALPHFDENRYVGAPEGSVEQLQDFLTDPNMWFGSNNEDDVASLPVEFSIFASPLLIYPRMPTTGDVMVVAMNSVDPDMVALVALKDLPGGLEIYMTDNAWTGSEFLTNEGTLLLKLPSQGVDAGTIFGYGDDTLKLHDQWQTVGGRFDLAETGDTVILYTEEDGQIHPLSAFSYAGVGNWSPSGLSADQYGEAGSALPEILQSVGAVSLPGFDNYVYKGPIQGETLFLQGALQDVSNWDGYDTGRVEAPKQDFQVVQVPSTQELSSAASSLMIASRWILFATALLVAGHFSLGG